MIKFVLARHIRDVVDLHTVDFADRAIQHDDAMLAVSLKVRSFYADNDSTAAEQAAFAKEARAFYCAVVTKMVAKFPFGDPVLRDLGVLDPTTRVNLTYEPIVRLAARFTPDVDAEQLKEEYEDFQLLGENAITLVEDGESRPIDHVWADILALKTPLGVVLVRYLIPTIFIDTWIWFDTRYSILDTFVVDLPKTYKPIVQPSRWSC